MYCAAIAACPVSKPPLRQTAGIFRLAYITQVVRLHDCDDRDRSKERNVSTPHAVRFNDRTTFFVRHRHIEYGPFDYEWVPNLRGIEFTYCHQKFGEFYDILEIQADLKEFKLPMRVVEVSSVVTGSIVLGLLCGLEGEEKRRMIEENLERFGLHRFAANIEGWM